MLSIWLQPASEEKIAHRSGPRKHPKNSLGTLFSSFRLGFPSGRGRALALVDIECCSILFLAQNRYHFPIYPLEPGARSAIGSKGIKNPPALILS